jgi:hypothetical protein
LEPLYSSRAQEGSYTSAPPGESRFGADERVDVEPGERARAQEKRPLPGSVEAESSREIASRPAGQEEGVVNDDLSDEPEHRWEKQTTEGGVTMHRRTR